MMGKEETVMSFTQDQETALECIRGLTYYAMERQADNLTHLNPTEFQIHLENRNAKIRNMIIHLSRFWGLSANLETEILKPFDDNICSAHCPAKIEIAGADQQKAVVSGLSRYADELIRTVDARSELMRVRNLLEDIAAYLPWNVFYQKAEPLRDQIDFPLASATARQNILFTHILLGAETGPAGSDFLSGAMEDEEGIRGTELFENLKTQHPEIRNWHTICTLYRCGNGLELPRNASSLDLQIMREKGENFLDLKGVTCCRMPIEFDMYLDEFSSYDSHSQKLNM